MANTYTKIYIMAVFAVKYRRALLNDYVQDQVYNIITAALLDMKCIPIAINGTSDHIHILYTLNPNLSVSDTVKEMKRQSSAWINQQRNFLGKFSWQEGYGAFSYSHSAIEKVKAYIENQKEHHSSKAFMQEYRGLLDKFEIEYKEEYILTDPM